MGRIGLVLGAGGVVGHAFHAGVLSALAEATDWDARNAELIVGTSAGSVVGSVLRAGLAPADLAAQWVTPDGQARLQISPSGNVNDNATLRAFAHAVQEAEPNATEGPISILEARQTILTAFFQAGAWALGHKAPYA